MTSTDHFNRIEAIATDQPCCQSYLATRLRIECEEQTPHSALFNVH